MKQTAGSFLVTTLVFWGAIASHPALGQTADPYQALNRREFGTTSNELFAIEKEIGQTRPAQYAQIEARLLPVIEAQDSTIPGKQFACQMLRIVGSATCVPAVSRLLTDEKLSHVARQVLVGMPGAAVDNALRNALASTQGNLRIGLINTIGDRGDGNSLNPIVALAEDNDPATAGAALNAIGKMGGPAAAAALDRLKVAEALKPAWSDAYLRCAAGFAKSGDTKRAEKMFRTLLDGPNPLPARAGAFGALVKVQQEQAIPLILKTLGAPEPILQRAAIGAVATLPGHAATEAFARQLPSLGADEKVALIAALAARGDAQGLTETVNKLATDQDDSTRLAAVKALARLGNASSVPVLTASLKEGTSAEAVQSMIELQGNGISEALMQQFDTGDASVRQAVLTAFAARRQPDAMPAVRKGLTDPDAKVRQAALKAVATMAGVREVASAETLKMVEPSLDDAAVKSDAFIAYEKIAEALAGPQPAVAKEALQRVADNAPDNGLRGRALKALDKIK